MTKEQKPMPVVIAALVHKNKILLIKRQQGDYLGFWGLPGGKIEKGEYLFEAAEREILEETGLKSNFDRYLGFISEHLKENGRIKEHFLLHLCQLRPTTFKIVDGQAGRVKWFNLRGLKKMKNKIIPSDFLMIEKMVKSQKGLYFNCLIEKSKKKHYLRCFDGM